MNLRSNTREKCNITAGAFEVSVLSLLSTIFIKNLQNPNLTGANLSGGAPYNNRDKIYT